jgi:hypothetical protein
VFQNEELKQHIETSSTIRSQTAVIAEWNMNIPNNILKIGNYRYRPTASSELTDPDFKYRIVPNSFDKLDEGNYYTDATDADVVIDGGFDDEDSPQLFLSKKDKSKLIYSLEDCFQKFRPRSGINKASYFNSKFLHHTNINMAQRPRYYMADKNDGFKYWTSYRTENGIERGVANKFLNSLNYIDDAVPFIVYKDPVPANRIVVKMQTNVGDLDLGPFTNSSGSFDDPLYGDRNKTTPVKWKVQYLDNDNWIDVISFNSFDTRSDGSPIIKSDGYVEISYGLIVPNKYKEVFVKAEEYSSVNPLPEKSVNGYAYLIKENELDIGIYYIWFEGKYETFIPSYGWYLEEGEVDRLTNFATDLTDPISYIDSSNGKFAYREFSYLSGIRIVVDTMNKADSTFDLIEISPRLSVDLSDKTSSLSINKIASDLGVSGMPVGQLLASTGEVVLFDYDQAFNENNKGSIIHNYLTKNIQFKIYEIISDLNGYDYYVPIKTMYSEGFPSVSNQDRMVSLPLRDLFFYFESLTAPQILSTNASLSYAISLLFDSIGFSNYVFYRTENEKELIIPFFYIPPDKTIAEILNDLALSTQTAMFFDEYNNFVMMSKDYILPSNNERDVDLELIGSRDFEDTGVIENNRTQEKISNIIEISSEDSNVFNDGKINYQTRYIQKSYGSLRQASMIDQEKTWIYKPALLWEVAGTETTKAINDQANNQSSFVLGAIPLNSYLSNDVPLVVNNQVINNTMDFGEGVYWLSRYNGYFYANGEIIKYDAVEYNISGFGNVWINNVQEYQNYFSKLPFNGKIYPTGLIRIYSEPNYEVSGGITKLKNGEVFKHGRGQFGTTIVDHHAGLNSYWSDNANIRGCSMKSEYLFNLSDPNISANVPVILGEAGVSNSLATKTTRNGIIKNFLANSFLSESDINTLKSVQTGTIQSSALVMNGPSFTTTEKPVDFISYVNKPLNNKFKHFGTRVRLIGKIENNENRGQTPIGTTGYYVVTGSKPEQSINIAGGSGGLAVMVNPSTNNGYYFEIIALTENNIEDYNDVSDNLHNIIFYKIVKDAGSSSAIPIKLWGGLSKIVVDDGKFTGQYRMAGEENPTVYDLAVEYQDIGNIRRFYLYINQKLITTVDDATPLPVYNNMGIFVRGSSRAMFENIYALSNNYSQNTSFALDTPIFSATDDPEIDANESFRKYAMSGIVQATHLSGISPSQSPSYNIYFEEFGTIMREAAYMNVRYDKAYPALYAKISPTFNRIKGYTVSGFKAGAYGAEFLIFNATDTALSLDETTGNYLRIQGVTFTQQSQHELSVDEYFNRISDFSNPDIVGDTIIRSPLKEFEKYQDIKISRMTHGKKDFSLEVPYIQTQDDANSLMSWIISKIMKPRKSVGVKIFSNPLLQLGDIVTIKYKDSNLIDQVSEQNTKFVVYNINYSKSVDGPEMTIYLSEVS